MSKKEPAIAGDVRSISYADGGKVEYEIVGAGQPLVLLHGFLSNRFTFSRQRNQLARHHRLVLINFRGSVGSNQPLPPNYGVGTSDLDDLCRVLDAEQLDFVNLFGHSSGGATGLVFANLYPDRIGRAVLLEPTLVSLLPPEDRARLISVHEEVAASSKIDEPHGALRAALELVGGPDWQSLNEKTQLERLTRLAEAEKFVGPHVLSLNALSVKDNDIRDFMTPTLFLYGDNSYWFESLIMSRIRTLRADLQVLTIPEAGHNVHRDQAERVNAEVLAFLSG